MPKPGLFLGFFLLELEWGLVLVWGKLLHRRLSQPLICAPPFLGRSCLFVSDPGDPVEGRGRGGGRIWLGQVAAKPSSGCYQLQAEQIEPGPLFLEKESGAAWLHHFCSSLTQTLWVRGLKQQQEPACQTGVRQKPTHPWNLSSQQLVARLASYGAAST